MESREFYDEEFNTLVRKWMRGRKKKATREAETSGVMATLALLRSLWTMPCSWACARASAIWVP